MHKEFLDVAIAQITSVDSLAVNLQKFTSIFSTLKPNEVDLICFPENCLFMRIQTTDAIEQFDLTHSCFLWLGDWAKRLRATIHLGSVPLIINGKLFNSSVWIGQDGIPQVGYQKRHLFDIELSGQKPIKESDLFNRGIENRIMQFKGWNIGESICYDLRFSELYLEYSIAGADLILVPSSFLVETGRAHWEILLRARAIENQTYIVASAQVGTHKSTKSKAERQTYGHSLIVDPWGNIEVDLKLSEGIQIRRILKDKIKNVRTQIPMASHR